MYHKVKWFIEIQNTQPDDITIQVLPKIQNHPQTYVFSSGPYTELKNISNSADVESVHALKIRVMV